MLTKKISQSLVALAVLSQSAVAADVTLLNVSYDPTRELYQDYNAAFARHWKARTGDNVTVKQSHGVQARTVIDGLGADVLALAYDINAAAERGLIKPDWQQRLQHNSSPYTSTIVFLVRKGNPKGIKDWGDLIKPGVAVITPNPKTSGGARWNYLAAWGYALKQPGGTGASARVLAEPPVALVDKHGTRKVAEACLQYLYSDEGQEIAAKNYYRPTSEKILKTYAAQYPKVKLFTIGDVAGNWAKTQKTHFADGGLFDQIYQPGRK